MLDLKCKHNSCVLCVTDLGKSGEGQVVGVATQIDLLSIVIGMDLVTISLVHPVLNLDLLKKVLLGILLI